MNCEFFYEEKQLSLFRIDNYVAGVKNVPVWQSEISRFLWQLWLAPEVWQVAAKGWVSRIQSLNPEKKPDLLRKCESKKNVPCRYYCGFAWNTAHQLLRKPQLLRPKYCGNPNIYCVRNTAILFWSSELTINLGVLYFII